MKRSNTSTQTLQRLAIRGAVAAVALAVMLLGGLLPVRTTHGTTGTFKPPVASEGFYTYPLGCDPGSLHTALDGTTQPTWASPVVITIDDVQQCIAVKGARHPIEFPNPPGTCPAGPCYTAADMQIESELFKYATISTGSGYGTRLTTPTIDNLACSPCPDIAVMDNSGAAASGLLEIGSEYFSYTAKGANTFTGIERAQNGSAREAHTGGASDGDFVFASPSASGNVLDVQTDLNVPAGIGTTETTIIVDSTTGAASAGVLQMDEFPNAVPHVERMSYTGITPTSFTGVTRGVGGTTAVTHGDEAAVSAPKAVPFDLEVGDAVTETGFTTLVGNHYVCIVNELVQFDPTASSGDGTNNGADTLHVIARGDTTIPAGFSCGAASGTSTGPSAQPHRTPGAGLRDATRIQLLQRAMGNPATAKAVHALNAAMSSPQTTSHNLTAYTLGSQINSHLWNIVGSSKVYSTVAVFPPPPPPPYNSQTTEEPTYHYQSRGTFDTDTAELKVETMLTYPNQAVCALSGGLYVHIPTDVTWGAQPLGNTAYGTFRLEVWLTDTTCSGTPNYSFGQTVSIDGQATGINYKTTGLPANSDSDIPASPGPDGCTNVQELQTAAGTEVSGGRRDPFNPYDFFDPVHAVTGPFQVLVPDILAVVQQYFIDDLPGPIDMKSKTDRTYLGPNVWNLGPPDGLQRVPDILAVVKQYFDTCG